MKQVTYNDKNYNLMILQLDFSLENNPRINGNNLWELVNLSSEVHENELLIDDNKSFIEIAKPFVDVETGFEKIGENFKEVYNQVNDDKIVFIYDVFSYEDDEDKAYYELSIETEEDSDRGVPSLFYIVKESHLLKYFGKDSSFFEKDSEEILLTISAELANFYYYISEQLFNFFFVDENGNEAKDLPFPSSGYGIFGLEAVRKLLPEDYANEDLMQYVILNENNQMDDDY